MHLFKTFSKISMVMASSVMLSSAILSIPALAANVSDQEQTIRIAAAATIKSVDLVADTVTTTYQVGQGFKASEISFRVNYSDGTSKIIKHDSLKFTANGQEVSNGYKWKTVGTKRVIVTYNDYSTEFNVEVKPTIVKTVDDYELVTTDERLDYKVGEGFRADDLYFRFFYSDGTSEDFGYKKLYIHTSDGVELVNNYKFQVAGNKTIVVECQGYSVSYDIYVSPSGTAKNTSANKDAWSQSPNGTWQYYRNGSLVKGWLEAKDGWYYFDKDGDMAADGWIEDGGKWYYLNKDGNMMAGGWLAADGKWYYLSQSGSMMADGWLHDSGKWYYLDKDGNMLANGWIEDNGFSYYLNADGTMAVSTTIDGVAVGADGRRP